MRTPPNSSKFEQIAALCELTEAPEISAKSLRNLFETTANHSEIGLIVKQR